MIFYFIDEDDVLYLIDLYRKNERANLSAKETALIAEICKAIKKTRA